MNRYIQKTAFSQLEKSRPSERLKGLTHDLHMQQHIEGEGVDKIVVFRKGKPGKIVKLHSQIWREQA